MSWLQLLFRTTSRELRLPNANEDYIAPLFRDKLMPVRSMVNRLFPWMVEVYKARGSAAADSHFLIQLAASHRV